MKNKFNNFTIQAGEELQAGESIAVTPEMKKAAAEALQNEITLAEIQAAAAAAPKPKSGKGFLGKYKPAIEVAKETLKRQEIEANNKAGNKYFLIIAALAIVAGVYWFYFRKK